MKTIYLLIASLLFTCLQSNAQTWQWTHPEPNGSAAIVTNDDEAHDMETDASGNVYVLGDFKDSLFLSNIYRAKGNGSYLAKYDSTGKLLWYKLMIPTSNSTVSIKGTDLTVTAQGVFVIGKYDKSYNDGNNIYNYSYNIGTYNLISGIDDAGLFLTKFNSNGGVTWSNKLVTNPQVAGDFYNGSAIHFNPLITSDKNNNIICEFIYNGPQGWNMSIGSNTIPALVFSNFNIVVFKMNNAGTLLWSNHAENSLYPNQNQISTACHSIITDKNGNIFLYGRETDYCNFGSIIYHTNYFLKNDSYPTYSSFIAKLSSAGEWQFAKELVNTNFDGYPNGNLEFLTTDDNNNLYALINLNLNIGFSYGVIMGDTVSIIGDGPQTYIVKLNNAGNLIWHKGFGNMTSESAANSIYYANNALYLSGKLFTGFDSYFSDVYLPLAYIGSPSHLYYVAKANSNGDFQWVSTIGTSGGQYSEGLAVRAFNDNVYTAGYYWEAITTLGNLNGSYQGEYGLNNIFFGKLKDQYIRVGAVSAKQVMPGCSITIPFTSTGLTFSAKNKFTAELSNASGDFTAPTVIGSVKSTGTGSIKATIPSSLAVGTNGYRIRIRSTDTLLTGFNYFAYADTGYALSIACPGTASGLSSTNITGTSATVNWAAVACAAGYKIQYRIKGTTGWTTQNTNSTTVSLSLSGLPVNTTYQWRIATKCNNNGVNSFSAFSPIQQFTTAPSFVANRNTENIHAESNLKLFVQPNPAKSATTIVIGAAVKNAVIIVTDFVGKTVWKKTGVNAGNFNFPVENLAAGIYLVKLINGNETSMVKFIKE